VMLIAAVHESAYGPKADILIAPRDVRLRGNSGHRNSTMSCLLMTHMYGPAVRSKKILTS
jgi:hypothetical protein